MNSKLYKDNLNKVCIYTVALIVFFLFIRIFKIQFIEELTGANLILAIITIPCCVLHYNSDRNSSFFIYILIYTSTCVETLCKWYLSTNNIIIYDLIFTFSYRVFLLSLLLYAESKFVKKFMKYDTLIFFISLFVDFFIVYINIFLGQHTYLHLYIKPLFFIVTIVAYIIIAKLTMLTFKKRNFILTIYNISILIFALRLLSMFGFEYFNIPQNIVAEDKICFFIALFILLVGLFIQIKNILKINRGLNRDVKNITANVKEIQELEKMRSYFFANLSHELKTPLNMLTSSMQLLELKKNISDEDFINSYIKYEKSIKQNILRMVRLTNNFVDISKIDAGFMNLQFKNYNIVDLVENITMSVLLYVENKKINLIFDTAEEELYIKCDSDAIERIVLNLLSNSIKFTKENGNIYVDILSDDDYIYIKVKDDGCGIEPEIKEHVFKIYIQGDKSLSRKKEGSGIGLSLVQSLAKLHDGDVYIEDTKIGTCIVVKLPKVILPQDNLQYIGANINHSSNAIVEKVNIEFSDIYD